MKTNDKKFNLILYVLAVIIIIISILPLLRNDFIRTHDNNLYPILQYEFDQGIKERHFLPRWSADFWLGLGSPMFNFIQPLFFYLAEIFHLLGFGLVTAIKIVIILGFILGFISMYLFAKEIWGREGGFISAVIYTFFPYRLALVYIRGAFAEFLVTSLFPLIIFFFLKLIQTKKRIYFLLASLSIALLLLCHNLQALFFLPLLLIYLIYISWPKMKEIIKPIILSLILGLGLAAFFTLPAFFERNYLEMSGLREGNYDFHNYFLKIGDLFPPKWDTFNFYQIGAVGVILLVLIVFVLFASKKQFQNIEKKNIYFFTLVIIVFSVLTLPVSAFFWEQAPLVNIIQFPWRVLCFQALGFAVLGGLLLKAENLKLIFTRKFSLKVVVIFFSMIIVLANFMFAKPAGYLKVEADQNYNPFNQAFKDAMVFRNVELTKKGIEDLNVILKNFPVEFTYLFSTIPYIVPRGIDLEKFVEETTYTIINLVATGNEQNFKKIYPRINVLEGEVQWSEDKQDSYATAFILKANQDSIIFINQFWFPGWQAYLDNQLDNQKIEINHDNNLQIMTFNIPKGEHILKLYFKDTFIRIISEIISVLAWGVWLFLLIKYFRNKKTPDRKFHRGVN